VDQPWTEDSVARTLINPNYCLTDPPVVTEEKWIEANTKFVQKMGVESLSGDTIERPSGRQ
jgi:uncharacterized protein (DUF362 family)